MIKARWIEGKWIKGKWIEGKWIKVKWIEGKWIKARWIEGKWIKGKWIKGKWIKGKWIEGKWIEGRWISADFLKPLTVRWFLLNLEKSKIKVNIKEIIQYKKWNFVDCLMRNKHEYPELNTKINNRI